MPSGCRDAGGVFPPRSTTELDDYLEGLEFGKPTEEMVEVSLGNFRVPLTGGTPGMQPGSDWMELKFQLFVVVPPSDKQEVLQTMEDHRGAVRDSVFRVCRSISLDELSDPGSPRSRPG